MMSAALQVWAARNGGGLSSKADRDQFRGAVNDIIMLFNEDRPEATGWALGGLLELAFTISQTDDRHSLMLRWQETDIFRMLIDP